MPCVEVLVHRQLGICWISYYSDRKNPFTIVFIYYDNNNNNNNIIDDNNESFKKYISASFHKSLLERAVIFI